MPKENPLQGLRFNPERPLDNMNLVVEKLQEKMVEARSARSKALKGEAASTAKMMDAGYYCVVVFDTVGQCDAFIEALKLKIDMSKLGDLFLDGRDLADAFGIAIPEPEYKLTLKPYSRNDKANTLPTIASLKDKKRGRRKA
jgi:hypothetical protein